MLKRPPTENPLDDPQTGEELNIKVEEISKQEIRGNIKRLKNIKAPGIDNIQADAVKAGGDSSVDMLYKCLNVIWLKEKVPNDWKKGVLVKIPKKGDLSICGNWKGIMLLSVVTKLMSRIILERMKNELAKKLREEQAGFRQGNNCADQTATRHIIIKQSVEWQSSVYMNFIDFEKVFDSVDRTVLWKLLRHYGVPDKVSKVIKAFYKWFPVRVSHRNGLSREFFMETGV